jgi:hypothetical protein
MKHLLESATENTSFKYEDTKEEEKYNTLKIFFESTIEQDDFTKLKDGYTVLDSKDNICYFKRGTLAEFLEKRKTPFKSVNAAVKLLECKKHDFFEGERNVWYVEMPEFVNHQKIKPKNQQAELSEMDDEYHSKFRAPETKTDTPQNN